MNTIAHFLLYSGVGAWAVESLLGVTVILVLALAASMIWARNRPALRHALWLGALLGVLTMPLLSGLSKKAHWTLATFRFELPTRSSIEVNGTSTFDSANTINGEHRSPNESDLASEFRSKNSLPAHQLNVPNGEREDADDAGMKNPAKNHATKLLPTITGAIALTWIIGSLFLIVRLVVGWRRSRNILREVVPVGADWRTAEVRRVQKLFQRSELPPIGLSSSTQVPMVVGLFKPQIILPELITKTMTTEELVDTLIHECAHVIRKDLYVVIMQRITLILFWPHPLLHYLNRQLESAREELCDNHVLVSTRASSYAETLLRLSEVCLPTERWVSGLGIFRRAHNLEERICRLVDRGRDRNLKASTSTRWFVTGAMITLVVTLATLRVSSAPADAPFSTKAITEPKTDVKSPAAKQLVQSDNNPDIARRVAELTADWRELTNVFANSEDYAKQIRELVHIGRPAVPTLNDLLDRTDTDVSMRLLGFTLRAIGDPRAVPALIRAIPRTLRKPGSDCGMPLSDRDLLSFMQQNDLHDSDSDSLAADFMICRPVREICGALVKITGATHKEPQLFNSFLEGGERQQAMQRAFYIDTAQNWASWWRQNGNDFTSDSKYSSVQLPAPPRVPPPGAFPHGANLEITDSHAFVIIPPAEEQGDRCFLDLDLSRYLGWRDVFPQTEWKQVSSDELIRQSAENTLDLLGTRYEDANSDRSWYCLRNLGLQAWEIPNNRWDTILDDLGSHSPSDLGSPAHELLMHFDPATSQYVPNRKATFLFVTREGTPGILRIVGQVNERDAASGNERLGDPLAQRYGLRQPSAKDSGEQEEEFAQFHNHGVKIEYAFLYEQNR